MKEMFLTSVQDKIDMDRKYIEDTTVMALVKPSNTLLNVDGHDALTVKNWL